MTAAADTALPTYDALQPGPVWEDFAAMSAVPRPSKKEERILDMLKNLSRERGYTVDQDKVGNLVIRVPGAGGGEDAPTVILQAHVDMVCEKNSGTEHDFDRDPIRLLVDRDGDGDLIVRADGTTLGADNGIGVCLALAAARADIKRPPLEILLTVDEEAGMTGAEHLDGSLLNGRTLINLDTEEDAALYVGCAGGCDISLGWTFDAEPFAGQAHEIVVRGLRGGHSGGDIHEGRGSANKVLTRLLGRLLGQAPGLRLLHIDGGSKRNAIAREASALVAGDGDGLRRAAAEVEAEARAESKEPELTIRIESRDVDAPALPVEPSGRVIRALAAVPHGVVGMHPDVPGLVETSNNLATVELKAVGDGISVQVGCLSRSSSPSRMEEVLNQIGAVGELAGATVERANSYPGWEPNMDSAVLQVCRDVHEETFGAPPKIAAVHAGLECGLLGRRVEGLDMVSLGPRIEGAHSPDERVWVRSVQLSWTYLTAVLERLAQR